MSAREVAQRRAVRMALDLRRKVQLPPNRPVCPYDIAEQLGVQVRFIDIPSMEGMYSGYGRPRILISSLRPAPRRSFTCAHELGHHAFGHGYRVDARSKAAPSGAEDLMVEVSADRFAAELLMPAMGIRGAFAARRLNAESCLPEEIYRVCCQFGVGYSTLVNHLNYTLGLIDPARHRALLRTSPAAIQKRLIGYGEGRLILVDNSWAAIPIDLETDDLVMLPPNTASEGDVLEVLSCQRGQSLYRARRPGIGRVEDGTGWSAFVRVARRDFVGLSRFRHLQDAEYE